MNSGKAPSLEQMVNAWVRATEGKTVGVPSSILIGRRLAAIRSGIHDTNVLAKELGTPDETLAVLSQLAWELLRVGRPSHATLREAETAFDFLSGLTWPSDEFGEVPELLCQFAFIAWRHSRALNDISRSSVWVENYERVFDNRHVSREGLDELFMCLSEVKGSTGAFAQLREPERVFALCAVIGEAGNRCPDRVLSVAANTHRLLEGHIGSIGHFGEKPYLLAETAVSAASASRVLGKWNETRQWLEVIAGICHSDPRLRPQLLKGQFVRLALEFGHSHDRKVLEETPSLIVQMEQLEMKAYALKVRLLEAAACLNVGQVTEAVHELESLRDSSRQTHTLRPWVLTRLAEAKALLGDYREAETLLRLATQAALDTDQPIVLADTCVVIAQGYREKGMLTEAVENYREAISGFGKLRMPTQVAYLRVILSETLIALGRNEEAELELLAALPTLEAERMEPAAMAAVSLLRESVRRRKTDRSALQTLREHVQRRGGRWSRLKTSP